MFQKLIGKRKKDEDWFHIPQKKYTTDQKVISKMGPNALKDLFADQEKYVNILTEKIEQAKNDYQRLNDKIDELQQKNEVVNAQISRMTNQHEELTIKFDNLQTSLEIVSSQSDNLYKKEIQFLNEYEVNCDKIKNLNSVIIFYRERFTLCKKIEQQNKNLKSKYSEMEQELEQADNVIKELQQQLKDLRQNKKNNSKQENREVQQQYSSQLETVSTLKSAEDEEVLQKYKGISLQLQKKNQQISIAKQKIAAFQQQNKDLTQKLNKYAQKISKSQSQIGKLKELISKYEAEIEMNLNKELSISQNCQRLNTTIKKLQAQIGQLKTNNKKASENINELNKQLQNRQKECNKLLLTLQSKQQTLQNKESQLVRQKQNRVAMQGLLSNKNNNQMESLLKIKTKNQAQIQQLRQNCDSLKKNVLQHQAKGKQISQQLQNVKTSNKRLAQQKLMIQQNVNTCLKISQDQAQRSKQIEKDLKKQVQQFKKQAQITSSKLKSSQNQIKSLTLQTQKLFKTLQGKQAELKKNYTCLQQLQKQKAAINQMIGEKQQDNKIRIRKYQSELNQQRIKIENLNRKIANLQSKAEQSKISLDSMYQQMLSKDKRIVHMETKLKEYKYIIQVQKKERQQLEQSYEKTVNSLKPSQMPKTDIIEKENNLLQQVVQKQPDHQKQNLKNELLSIKEQNIVVLSENESLRKKIQEFQEIIHQKTRTIKILQEKRDQIMKEIQKMNKKSNPNQKSSSNSIPINSPVGMIRIQSKQHESRQKKIAAKAHKGFDILLKLQHQLYKNFINVFAVDLNRQEVKSIQGQINSIVKKSSDMKDIFEDYL